MTKKETNNIQGMNIYEKINKIREEIRKHEFTLDKCLPSNLGSAEYASIAQYYSILHKTTIKYNVFFKWDVMEELEFEKNVFQPAGKLPQHLHTVSCVATFINIDNPEEVVEYMSIASGSDSLDKGVSSASTMAFRNWFDKNFSPKYLTDDILDTELELGETEKSAEPKVPTYIPAEKKAELVKEVVADKQTENTNSDDVKRIIGNIMKVRELLNDQEWGAKTLGLLMQDDIDSVALMQIDLKVANKLDSLGGE